MTENMPRRLPRRDFLLLPLIAIVTIGVLIGTAEFAASRSFNEFGVDTCMMPGSGHHKANCSVMLKNAEGPAYLEAYNDCGYRSHAPCGPKPPGTARIAVLGSSFTLGDNVAYDDTFIARTEKQLNAACPRHFEFQNLSAVAQQPLPVYRRTDEALALKPDVLLLSFSPTDADVNYTDEDLRNRNIVIPEIPRQRPGKSFLTTVMNFNIAPATQRAARHFLFQNEEKYLYLYLRTGDQADFLRQPFTPIWQRRLQQMDIIMGAIADKARAQGVPIVFVAGLQRAEAGLISSSRSSVLPVGVDPFAFEVEMARLAAKHGMINIDPDPYFRRIPHASNLFYAVDGHLDANGNAVFAEALGAGLLSSGLPAFQGCRMPSPLPTAANPVRAGLDGRN